MTEHIGWSGHHRQRRDRHGLERRLERRLGRDVGFALTVAVLSLLGLGFPAQAQSPSFPVPNQVERGSETVDLTMEQRHIVKEIIIKEMKIEPQPHAGGLPTRIGGTVPSGIPLQPMPVEVTAKIPQLKAHSFLVQDEKVIVVDPKNNKVAALIE
jgi:hypothetical protein